MAVPPRNASFSTTTTWPPSSATPRAASSPAGPPPMTAMVSDIRCPPVGDAGAFCRLGAGASAHVVPRGVLPFTRLQLLQVLLELGPGGLPVDAHLLQQRAVVG